jgi:tetratricopeptide (TPR) repeat protein
MTSAGKLVAMAATGLALGAMAIGYWFWSAARAGTRTSVTQLEVSRTPTMNPSSPRGAEPLPEEVTSNPIDFGPDMPEIEAIQGNAGIALQAERWDEAASLAKRGLAIVEKRAGGNEPLRIPFISFQVEAATGAKRFAEAAAFLQALKDQMARSPAQWQDYLITVHRAQAAILESQGKFGDAAAEWAQALETNRKDGKAAHKDIDMLYLTSQVNDLVRANRPSDAKGAIEAELARPENSQTDAGRIQARLKIARHIRDANLQTALWLARDALGIGRRLQDSRLNLDAIEAEAAVADIEFRASGRAEPENKKASRPEIVQTMEEMQKQSEAFDNAGKPRDALQVMAKRLELVGQAEGTDSVVYGLALNDFAMAASSAGLVDMGEKASRQAISIIEAKDGRESYDLATPLNNLADLLTFSDRDHSSEVEMLQQRALAIDERFHGPLDLDSLVTRANMGYVKKQLKRWEQAERSYKEAIAIAMWHGDESEAASAWFGMFELRRDQGRLNEGEPYVLRSFDLRAKALGLGHPKTLMVMNNIVWMKRMLGKPQEAVKYLEQLAASEAEVYGPEDMRTFLRRWELAGLYGDVGEWQKADDLGRKLESQESAVYAHPLGEGFDPRVPR